MLNRFVLCALALCVGSTTFAKLPPPLRVKDFTYGIELTATTDQNPEYDIGYPIRGKKCDFALLAAQRFAELTGGKILPRTADGEVPVVVDGAKWNFENDSGVLEVASPVLTIERIKETETIFQVFHDIGLKPEVKIGGLEGGGGHIHLGRQIFDRNPLLLRNFIVDVLNRPYIQGVLEEPGDDQAMSLRDRGLEKKLAQALRDIDSRFANGEPVTCEEIAKAVLGTFGDGKEVRVPRGDAIYKWTGRYSDLNLTNFLTNLHPTVELRLMRAPATLEELTARVKLFTRYLQKLDQIREPIALELYSKTEKSWRELPSVMRTDWEGFVSELGLDPAPYRAQFESRFPALVSAGATDAQGNRELEIREGRSLVEVRNVYELRFLGAAPPSLTVELGRSKLHPLFRKLEPGVWLAQLVIGSDASPEFKIEARGASGGIIARLTGMYKIGDGRLANDGIGERSVFAPDRPVEAEKDLARAQPKFEARRSCQRILLGSAS